MNVDYTKILEQLENVIELQKSNDYPHVKAQMTINMLKRILANLNQKTI